MMGSSIVPSRSHSSTAVTEGTLVQPSARAPGTCDGDTVYAMLVTTLVTHVSFVASFRIPMLRSTSRRCPPHLRFTGNPRPVSEGTKPHDNTVQREGRRTRAKQQSELRAF